jgi:hypothetical protein
VNRAEDARWRLHVLNRSAELRWKYGEPESDDPGVLDTDIDVPRLRRAYGADLEQVVRRHRDLLMQERQRNGAVASAAPVWEREPW